MDHSAGLCKGMDRGLYRASKSGDAKLLGQVLTERRVDVFQELTPAGDTALYMAALYGHAQLASTLIQLASQNPEAGMQFLKAQNTDGSTALHAAAEGGWKKIVKVLVEKESSLARVKNKDGETALFKASEYGHVDIVKCLLECTPEEEDTRADGQTPLHVAVAKLKRGVTDKLLEKRPALVHKADGFQRTALHILALVPAIGSWSTSRKANIGLIGKKLLDTESSLMYKVDANGQSPLHLGAEVGNAPLVEVILRYGTDCPLISDRDGKTALHLGVENASQIYERVGPDLKYIISSLAHRRLINFCDESGQTALDIAIQKVNEDKRLFLGITTYLRRHGANVKKCKTETTLENSASSTPRKPNRQMDMMSTNAVLIATVAFAAAFTLPGDIDTKGKHPFPLLLNESVFKLFVICDSLAFCSSVGSTVLFYYARVRNQKDHVLSTICYGGVWVSLTSIALAFGAAIHLLVAHKCKALAVAVWIMVGCLPIGVRLMSILGKVHLFTETTQFMVEFIRPLLVFILAFGFVMMFSLPVWWRTWILGSILTLGCLHGVSLAWRKRHVLMWYWTRNRIAIVFKCSFVVLFVSYLWARLFAPYKRSG